jgi:hypothetical protein
MTGEQLQHLYLAFWMVFGLGAASILGGIIWLVRTPNSWIGDVTPGQSRALKLCILGVILAAVTAVGLIRIKIAIDESNHKVSYTDTGGRHAGPPFLVFNHMDLFVTEWYSHRWR